MSPWEAAGRFLRSDLQLRPEHKCDGQENSLEKAAQSRTGWLLQSGGPVLLCRGGHHGAVYTEVHLSEMKLQPRLSSHQPHPEASVAARNWWCRVGHAQHHRKFCGMVLCLSTEPEGRRAQAAGEGQRSDSAGHLGLDVWIFSRSVSQPRYTGRVGGLIGCQMGGAGVCA